MENNREKVRKISQKLLKGFLSDKKRALAIVLLVSGAIMLVLSETIPQKNTQAAQTSTTIVAATENEYIENLENRLKSMISSIDGAGDTKVMITLESTSEEIYLHDYDYGENVDPEGKNSVERKDEYVIVDGGSGEQGIVVRTAQPKIRGVAVVCEGGESDTVRARITETVTALLDISSARVSVAKMN